MNRPRIALGQHAGRPQLLVDGSPFLVLGAELHNSSGSSAPSLAAGLDRAAAMHANTALVAVTWQLFEREEGRYDLEVVRTLLHTARERGLRLVILWFGTWKNGRSGYVPDWVKLDTERFPRAVTARGAVEHLSPFGEESRRRDAAAFAALMGALRDLDGDDRTVIMVQVENEVGLLGDSRDRGALAERAFADAVPQHVVELVEASPELALHDQWVARGRRREGTWIDLFGEGDRTDEGFMAVAYASYVDAVARAGRAAHDLPLFTNAWLDSEIDHPGLQLAGGQRPGTYPSGGPVASMLPVWRRFAPSLSFLAPDIYFGDFDRICARFAEGSDGVLFIPEMRRDAWGAGQIAVAIGRHGAVGTSPFGIDSGDGHDVEEVADLFQLLGRAAELVTARGAGDLHGLHLTAEQPEQRFELGGWTLRATRAPVLGGEPEADGYAVIVAEGDGTFVAIGRGIAVEPLDDAANGGLLSVVELVPGEDGLEQGRHLNGDETANGSAWVMPARGHAPLNAFPIRADGENSGITRARFYRF